MTNALLVCLIESKVEHEFNRKDFMINLVTLYGNVREKMAKQLEVGHFGLVLDHFDAASIAEPNIKVS